MIFIYFLYSYLVIGFVIAAWFVFFKVGTIDPGTHNTSIGFKLLLVPGTILLWPFILYKSLIS